MNLTDQITIDYLSLILMIYDTELSSRFDSTFNKILFCTVEYHRQKAGDTSSVENPKQAHSDLDHLCKLRNLKTTKIHNFSLKTF